MSGAFKTPMVLSLALWLVSASVAADQAADLVFTNGAVYTVNPDRSWAQAVAIRDGMIVFVGSDTGVLEFIGERTERVDLDGQMLLPGFHDSHMHPMSAGGRLLRCDLLGLEWPGAVLDRISECAEGLMPGKWFRAENLTPDAFENGANREMLDALFPDNPAFIRQFSGFTIWVNSRVLEVADINALTPDPEGGLIERYPDSGEPTGVLSNRGANLVYKVLPVPDEADLREALRRASAIANGFGITSSNAAQVRPPLVAAYIAADQADEMTLRINASQSWNPDAGMEQIEGIVQRRYQGRYFDSAGVKLFLDGDFHNDRASLLLPYQGTASYRGVAKFQPAQLDHLVALLDGAGLQVHMHAVGDRAVRDGLNAIEHAIEVNEPWDRRHQIAHLMLVDPTDLGRFKSLGVTADIQPLWAYRTEHNKLATKALGPQRATALLAFRSLFESGARVVAGSDWISESMNPLYAIQIAITRRPPDGSGPPWIPGQRLTLEQMIEAYTINGAWLPRQEHLTGSIEVGKAADLVVLDQNLFDIDPVTISTVRVVRTLLNGKTVWQLR